jgi:hypothetical protein
LGVSQNLLILEELIQPCSFLGILRAFWLFVAISYEWPCTFFGFMQLVDSMSKVGNVSLGSDDSFHRSSNISRLLIAEGSCQVGQSNKDKIKGATHKSYQFDQDGHQGLGVDPLFVGLFDIGRMK